MSPKKKFVSDFGTATDNPDQETTKILSDLHLTRFQYENDSFINDITARKSFGKCIFDFTLTWLLMVLVIFIAVGKDCLHCSDNILITFLTTTTATAVGLLVIVFKYLFKK
jgi:hypothetical protein